MSPVLGPGLMRFCGPASADLLAGTVYYRALITGEGLDGSRIGPALDLILTPSNQPG